MLQELSYNLRVVWACAKKDIKSALTERAFTIIGVFVPVNVLILMSLFVLAGSQAPTQSSCRIQAPMRSSSMSQ